MNSSLRSILVGFCSGYDIAQTHQKPSPLKANLMRRFMSLPRAQRLIALASGNRLIKSCMIVQPRMI
ncbi:hypothetical protein BT96DRAFT_925248 [Gymnopus androsaceus JB14]|uniref:Uncharacterized protein n=1 Tax=Gymnopus androsaceus JB14 TaxID=1447944 RepID=A0A6A4H1I4_9AGAR|nr:hypothetical protein BT96DRAFT_925248 [Gymnopus androsaceus JB14]